MFAIVGGGPDDAVATPRKNLEQPPISPNGIPGNPLIVPRTGADLDSHYDVTISHPSIDMPSFASFDRWLAECAAARGLTCALVHDGVVEDVIRRLDDDTLRIRFHLDYFALWHVPNDRYGRLAQAVQDAGGEPVNPPARSRFFTDKANVHVELQRIGLGVPHTVLVRPWTPDRGLTAEECARLRLDERGAGIYIKPANGFSGQGIMRVDETAPDRLAAALSAARNYDRHDSYLVQREVRPPALPCDDGIERPAYWRVLGCFGELIPFWWSKQELEHGRPSYRRLTATEIETHSLHPVLAYARELARLSQLQWFSTELCLGDGSEKSRYRVCGKDGRERPVVAIDYLNDQCDVDVQSRWPGAPPDVVVRSVARRFAEAAATCSAILPFRAPARLLTGRTAA